MSAMGTRFCLIVSMLTLLSGCIITPRFEMTERFDFNYSPIAQAPMSYSDILCCVDCTA